MPATTDGPDRMQLIATWTGGDADLLRRSLRMTNESFAQYLCVAVRTVANWRKQPEIIPKSAIQLVFPSFAVSERSRWRA